MNPTEEIKQAIHKSLDDAIVYIEDPRNDGVHLEAIVISEHFKGKSLLEQQQIVMRSLQSLFEKGLHALALKTYTPQKWKEYERTN